MLNVQGDFGDQIRWCEALFNPSENRLICDQVERQYSSPQQNQ